MAASFKIGQEVQVITVIPTGPVQQLAVDQAGNIQYLVAYVNSDGEGQTRWFNEDELKAV
jgi:uncharacterized protein YodC (DUF2158 family)